MFLTGRGTSLHVMIQEPRLLLNSGFVINELVSEVTVLICIKLAEGEREWRVIHGALVGHVLKWYTAFLLTLH